MITKQELEQNFPWLLESHAEVDKMPRAAWELRAILALDTLRRMHANPATQTIAEWFKSNLGDTVTISGMDAWGGAVMVRAYLPVDRDGSLSVKCGGDCIMAFETAAINKRPVYLVVEPARYRGDNDTRDRLSLHQSA